MRLLSVLSLLLLLALPCAPRPSVEETIEKLPTLLIPLLAKVPMAVPFMSKYIESEVCLESLKKVGKAAQGLEAKNKKKPEATEYTKADLKGLICPLGDQCLLSILKAMRRVVDTMSFVKNMVDGQLPEGLSLENVADMAQEQFSALCSARSQEL